MANFKRLKVWRKAYALSLNVDRVLTHIRGYAAFKTQLSRSAESVATNIVEGCERKSDPDFARFLRYSVKSTSETEYHLMRGRDRSIIKEAEYRFLARDTIEVRKMLHGLINRLEKKKKPDNQSERGKNHDRSNGS